MSSRIKKKVAMKRPAPADESDSEVQVFLSVYPSPFLMYFQRDRQAHRQQENESLCRSSSRSVCLPHLGLSTSLIDSFSRSTILEKLDKLEKADKWVFMSPSSFLSLTILQKAYSAQRS